MRRLFAYLPSFILLTWLTGCSDGPTGPSTIIEFMPIEIGNQWITQHSYFDTLGVQIQINLPDTVTIIGDTLINSQRWCYQYYLGYLLAYRNAESGAFIRLVSPNTDGVEKLLYQFPTYVGSAYAYPVVTFSGDSAWLSDTKDSCTVISVDTVLTVPAGTFHCVQYRTIRLPRSWTDHFVARDYGWIRTDYYAPFVPGGGVYRAGSIETIKIVLH